MKDSSTFTQTQAYAKKKSWMESRWKDYGQIMTSFLKEKIKPKNFTRKTLQRTQAQ